MRCQQVLCGEWEHSRCESEASSFYWDKVGSGSLLALCPQHDLKPGFEDSVLMFGHQNYRGRIVKLSRSQADRILEVQESARRAVCAIVEAG